MKTITVITINPPHTLTKTMALGEFHRIIAKMGYNLVKVLKVNNGIEYMLSGHNPIFIECELEKIQTMEEQSIQLPVHLL